MYSKEETKTNQSGQAIRYSAVVLIAVSFAVCTVLVSRAWVEPNTTPPGGNVAAPLHTGTTFQSKQGSLAVPILYDVNNTGYYVDPNGTSRLNYTVNDNVYSYGWIYSNSYLQAPAYYDSANSNYGFINRNVYADTINTGYSGDPLEINYYRQGDVNIGNGPAGGSNLRVYGNIYSSAAGVWMSQLCRSDGTNCPGSSDTLQTVTNRGWWTTQPLYTSYYMQSPIFYDANHGGYYLDPNGSSRLNQLYYVDSAYIVDLRPQYMYDWNDTSYYMDFNNTSRLNYLVTNNSYSYGWMQAGIYYDNQNTGYYVDPNGYSNVYAMQPVYSFNGPVYDYNNGGYYVDPNSTSRLNYGVFDNIYSAGWMQAPIFYDANNTGYYVDPNGSSRMNQLYYVDSAYVVDLRPQYMYDWNDTSYYMDFNNTSRLNYGVFNNIYSYGWIQAPTTYTNTLCLSGDCRSSWPSTAPPPCQCGGYACGSTMDTIAYYCPVGVAMNHYLCAYPGIWVWLSYTGSCSY